MTTSDDSRETLSVIKDVLEQNEDNFTTWCRLVKIFMPRMRGKREFFAQVVKAMARKRASERPKDCDPLAGHVDQIFELEYVLNSIGCPISPPADGAPID